MIKKCISIVLCLMMAVSLMPMEVFARDPKIDPKISSSETAKDKNGREYFTKIVLKPYTFYDIGGGSKKNLSDDTLTKLVDDDLIGPWSYIAMGCYKDAGYCATVDCDRFEKAFFNDYPKDNCFGNVRKILTGTDKSKGKVSRDNLWGTGLQVTNSLSDVRDEMAHQIVKQIDHNGCVAEDILAQGPEITDTKDSDYKKNCVLPEMKNNTTNQKVVYSIATSINERAWNTYRYNSFGIAFYDFQPRIIQAEDLDYKGAADGYKSLEEAKKKGVPGVGYDSTSTPVVSLAAINRSSGRSNESVEYSNGYTVTVTNSTTESNSYSFGTSLNIGKTWGAQKKVGELVTENTSFSLGLQFSFNTVYNTSTTESKAETHSELPKTSQSITMEPQTAAVLKTDKTKVTMSEDYDTPVMVSYKVAIFSLTGDVYADNGISGGGSYSTAGYKHGFYYNVIGGDSDATGISANENLYLRAIDNKTTKRKDASSGAVIHRYYKNNGGSDYNTLNVGTDWDSGLFIDPNEKVAQNLKKMTEEIPMLSCGCNYQITCDGFQNEVGELVPLYLPRKVVMTKGDGDYEMSIGNRLNLSRQLELNALNKNDVVYYGFHGSDGNWVSCDKSGKPMDNDSFTIDTNGAGDQILTAAKAGTGYVTWKMKNNVSYQAQDESGTVTAKTDMPSPIIEIRVKGTVFEGTIEVSGDFEACVGDSDVNLNNYLKTVCYDKTGKQVKECPIWEQRELDGIQVEESGQITMTKPGNYNVRAVVRNTSAGADDIYSDWYPITVKEERKLAKVELNQSMAGEGKIMLKEPVNSYRMYDLKSYLKGYDQYGDPWKGSFDDVTFLIYHQGEEENAYIDGNKLFVTGQGDFELHPVLNGGSAFNAGESNPIRFSVADNLVCDTQKMTLKTGESRKISAKDYDGKLINQGITFTSSDPEIAAVEQDGTVTGVSEGYADIRIRDGYGGLEICQVTVTSATDNSDTPDTPDKPQLKTNPLKVKGKSVKVKYKKLKKKTQTIKRSKGIIVKSAKGPLKFKLYYAKKGKKDFRKFFKINSKNGKIAVKKGLKKGLYILKVKVKAGGNAQYKPSSVKKVKIKVKVK